MNISVESTTDTRKTIVVAVSAEEIAAAESTLIKEFSSQARLPGFRPGKAPLDMVKRRYAKELDEELKRKISNDAYKAGIADSKLDVFSLVDAKGVSDIATGKAAELRFAVDVRPDFQVPEYKGIEVKVPAANVTDAEVEKAIAELRNQRAQYNPVEREARAGDYVKLSYEGTVDGKAISEIAPEKPMYGKQAVTWEEAGSKDAPGVRGIIDGIVGMKKGDKRDLTHSFPADFEVAALAGKNAVYAVEVLEVREKSLPEINEEFVKALGLEKVEDLHARIKDDLASRKQQENRTAIRQQIAATLRSRVEVALPESAVDSETRALMGDFLRRFAGRMPPEEIEKRRDEVMGKARETAKDNVKTDLILGKIAEKEQIKITDEDIHRRIMQEAIVSRMKPEQVVKELQKDPSLLNAMQRNVLFNKALDFLVDQAKVTEEVSA